MIEFIATQWSKFCENLERSAHHVASSDPHWDSTFVSECAAFQQSHQPESYPEFLKMIAEGVSLVEDWKQRAGYQADQSSDHDSNYTCLESKNHEPMPIPKASMAEHAKQARVLSDSNAD